MQQKRKGGQFLQSVVIPTAKRAFNARYQTPSGSYNATRMFGDAQAVYNTFASGGAGKAGPSRTRPTRSASVPTPLIRLRGGLLKRRRGATSSKSSGFFKKGTKKPHPLEYYATKGIVCSAEVGAVLQSSVSPFSQSVLVGHANYALKSLYKIVAMALTKMVATKMKRQLPSFSDVIEPTGQGNLILKLTFRPSLNGASSTINYTIVAGTGTWLNVTNWFETQLQNAGPSQVWTRLIMDDTIDATSIGSVRVFDCDMTKCRIQLYNKSSLKVQNRSINSTGNDDMDDVDNVPLYGKSYEGSGNYCIHKISADLVDVLTPNVKTTHQTFGGEDYWNPVFARLNTGTRGSLGIGGSSEPLIEPPTKAAFDRVKRVGKAHMDPGHIKTSVLTDRRGFLLQSFFRMVDYLVADEQALKPGSFKFFILEKMINSQLDTATNVIRVAYELDNKTGCIATAPTPSYTNYIYDQMNIGSSSGGN